MAYAEQFERARRSLQKLQKLSGLTASENITIPSPQQDEYLDALYHCFQDCWHLKDWIKNDDTAPAALRDAVDKMEHAKNRSKDWVESLMLCADVANGSKHLKFTKQRPRLNAKLQAEIMVRVGNSFHDNKHSDSSVAFRYSIVTPPDEEHEALGVAQQAFADWEMLITDKKVR